VYGESHVRVVPSLATERTRLAIRAQVIDVAPVREQGYETATVDAIAEAAGLSKRSFFRYFGSKRTS
jgi:AcrR family transcriptional regulator